MRPLTPPLQVNELVAFDMYFCSLASMSWHPGAGRSNGFGTAPKMTLEEAAETALDMIEVRRRAIGNQ